MATNPEVLEHTIYTTNLEDETGDGEAPSSNFKSVLDRFLGFKTSLAFSMNLQLAWVVMSFVFQGALLNGGPVSLVYGTILAVLGSTALAASLGEMASLDPTVGAQYRWTALFAPRVMSPAFWSLLQGWLTVFAWIASTAFVSFIVGTVIQGLIIFNNNNAYTPQRWHGTLLSWAAILTAIVWNIYARRLLTIFEVIGAICHILFFICIVVILLVKARHSSPEFVFTGFITGLSGWNSSGVSWCLGIVPSATVLACFDAIIHMTEEVIDAPKKVPRSMIWTVVLNGTLTFVFIICLLFSLSNFEAASTSPTGYPIIEVFYQATKSKALTNVMMIMLVILESVALLNCVASVSRLTWAFARDHGLPFSDFYASVHPRLHVPLQSLGLVGAICCLLPLIHIGSTTAFNAMLSLSTLALYISYIIPISLLLLRKLEGRHPAYGPFKLKRWGIPINLFAIVYGVFICIWLPFPPIRPVTWANVNYAGPVMLAVIVIAVVDWFISGHKRFKVPLKKTP